MSERTRPPNRRASINFTFECAGLRYTATVSGFADGSIGEVFLTNHKVNSQADVNARDAAVVASLALQYGVPIDVIRKALTRNADGTASGPLGTALDLIVGEVP
jgi:ribonucleoside-diphosphate reductase alpha chain